jgi:hypothetical protein
LYSSIKYFVNIMSKHKPFLYSSHLKIGFSIFD